MAPDSGEPDAAALRDRVAQLEQTVADQQATIDALSTPPVSRRGVLAALTGVAGAGAVGAYSQRASAQAAGQVGTQSEPVDVEAWSLTVQDQLAGNLDAGDNDLTNVGAVSVDALEADQADITETFMVASLSSGQSISSGDSYTTLQIDSVEEDVNNEYDTANYEFSPDLTGVYSVSLNPTFENGTAGDRVGLRVKEVGGGYFPAESGFSLDSSFNNTYNMSMDVRLFKDESYVVQARNRDSSIDVRSIFAPHLTIRSQFKR